MSDHPLNTGASGQKSNGKTRPIFTWGKLLLVIMVAVGSFFSFTTDIYTISHRIAGGVSGAVFGAVGGLLGGLLAVAFERLTSKIIPHTLKLGAASVGVMLGIMFGKATEIGIDVGLGGVRDTVHKEYVQPAVDRYFVRRALRQGGEAGRLYSLLEEKESNVFIEIVNTVERSLRSDATDEQIMSRIREVFIEKVSKPRLPYLNDDDLLQMFALSADLMEQLAQTNPVMCIAMAHGKPFGDLRPFVSPDVGKRESVLLEKLIGLPPRQFSLLPAPRLQAINSKVAAILSKKHGGSLVFLDPAQMPAGQERAACSMYVDYFREVLLLPKSESIGLLRAMLIDPSRLG